MPKSTNPLTEAQLDKAREIHKKVLDENATLKKIVNDAIAGKRGSERAEGLGGVQSTLFIDATHFTAIKLGLDFLRLTSQQRGGDDAGCPVPLSSCSN